MSRTLRFEAPAPNSALQRRQLHPDNAPPIPLETDLKPRDIQRLEQRQAALRPALRAYHDLRRQLQTVQAAGKAAQQAAADETGTEELAALRRQYRALCDQLAELTPQVTEYRQVSQQLAASRQRQRAQATHIEQAREAHTFADILISVLNGLGICYRAIVDGKEIVHEVRFAEIHSTPESHFFKLHVTEKTLFGYRRALPYGVRVYDILSDITLNEMAVACQRAVRGIQTPNNGAWIVVSRLDAGDDMPERVPYADLLEYYPQEEHPHLPIPVGVERGRVIRWLNLDDHPHVLLAGSTGGGKSNQLNNLIATLIRYHEPQAVRFVLIDLKEGLEFSAWQAIPHLLMPVVDRLAAAARVLDQLEGLRQERLEAIAAAGARDISDYNAAAAPEQRLPRIIVIFDEYASIYADRPLARRIEATLTQILNKGRSSGIQVWVSTQHPSTRIIPGHLKTNMSLRIATAMPSASASMTILDNNAAAHLPPVKGRILVRIGNEQVEMQSPQVLDRDIRAAVAVAMAYDKPPAIQLPDNPTSPLTAEELLALALADGDGDLKVSWLHRQVAERHQASFNTVRDLVKTITQMPQVTWQGQAYRPTRQRGNYYRLQPIEEPMS